MPQEIDGLGDRATSPKIWITAPMIGTFYASLPRRTPPFVIEGDAVYVVSPSGSSKQ